MAYKKQPVKGMTESQLGAEIRARRKDLDEQLAAGTIPAPRALTYTKPRGPSISGGPAAAGLDRTVVRVGLDT